MTTECDLGIEWRLRAAIATLTRHPSRSATEWRSPPYPSGSCWYAIDANDRRWSGEMPFSLIAARCSGVE